MGKFIITKRTNGEFQFSLKATNGQIILSSEGYSTNSNCRNGIESVITNAQNDSNFERKVSSNNKVYFNLKAANGQIIGISQMYESEVSRDNGILSVRNNVIQATIDDQSKIIA